MRRSERSPYTRIATDADKQTWLSVYAPIALVGFVQVTESDVTHWAAVIRNPRFGRSMRHTLHRLCDRHEVTGPTPAVEVNCMTCIVRIGKGPRGFR